MLSIPIFLHVVYGVRRHFEGEYLHFEFHFGLEYSYFVLSKVAIISAIILAGRL